MPRGREQLDLRQGLVETLEAFERWEAGEDPAPPSPLKGLDLGTILASWGFVRTHPPMPADWDTGLSYWIHGVHQHLQLSIPGLGAVHPGVGEAVLSMVNSILALEPIPADGPEQGKE